MPVQLGLLLVLLPVCSFAPGFYFVRRWRWTPMEKLCGSIGLSLILLYLAAWAIYCFGPNDERPLYWAVAGGSFVLGGLAWKDALRLCGTFRVRQALRWFGVLFLFTFLMLCIIRVYSGLGWYGDWYEHFQRVLFFLKRLPLHTPMYRRYQVPARPPMMNVLGAFFLGLTGDRFELFQVAFSFLNLLMFLPCLLILPSLGAGRRWSAGPLAVLFAASPMVMQEATYTWTKGLPVFYVVLALALYLAGWRKQDSWRMVAAFVALSAGLLAHYSAGPYVVFLTLHFTLWCVRRRQWRPWLYTAAICGLLLATWFGWSLAAYGVKSTLGSNTSVSGVEQYKGSNLEKIAANLYDSLVPSPLRDDAVTIEWSRGAPAMRDQAFRIYQLNLLFAMGSVGGPLVLWLLFRVFQRRKGSAGERRFWAILIPVCIVLGIAVVGERDTLGVAQLTLIPLSVLGLGLLAAHFSSMPRLVRFLLIAGCVVDFGFGVFLQAHVEGMENNNAPGAAFVDIFAESQGARERSAAADVVSRSTWINWALKRRYQLTHVWRAELPVRYRDYPEFQRAWPQIQAVLQQPLKEDAQFWGGWASRHGGVASYLGDWVAGSSGTGTDVAGALFCLLFLGLILWMARAAMQPSALPRTAPALHPHRTGSKRSRHASARRH